MDNLMDKFNYMWIYYNVVNHVQDLAKTNKQ